MVSLNDPEDVVVVAFVSTGVVVLKKPVVVGSGVVEFRDAEAVVFIKSEVIVESEVVMLDEPVIVELVLVVGTLEYVVVVELTILIAAS